MMNLSTLFFLVSKDSETEDDFRLLEETEMVAEAKNEILFNAPEKAVEQILGFASAYVSIPSVLMDEIELMKN